MNEENKENKENKETKICDCTREYLPPHIIEYNKYHPKSEYLKLSLAKVAKSDCEKCKGSGFMDSTDGGHKV